MSSLLSDTDARIMAVVLGLLMCGSWWLGAWRDRRITKIVRQPDAKPDSREATGQLAGASVALLGLLLAFTFSISLDRHEHRKLMIVEHSNSIGDFSTCASLLQDPDRGRLQDVLRRYVTHLLALPKSCVTEADLQRELAGNVTLHAEMQSLVNESIGRGTPIAIPLVNTFNEVTSSHEARLAAFRNRLPLSIMVLLCLSAVVTMFQIGLQNGTLDERELLTGAGFVVLVCLCVWVTLDLNQSQGGLIRISQEPMLRLLSNLNQTAPG